MAAVAVQDVDPVGSRARGGGSQARRAAAAEDAFLNGEIGYQQAAVLTRVINDVGVEAARKHESTLLEGARTYDPSYVRALGRFLHEVVDATGAQDEANAQHHRRRLHVSPTLDGVVYIDGRLDGDDGAAVMTALDSLMAPSPNDDRTAPQRRADALAELCRRQLDSGDLPQRGGRRPHLNLTVSLDKLRGDHTAPLAELEWVGSISYQAARRLACDPALTTVIVDAGGMPVVIIGPEVTVVPPHLRRALAIRDGGCIFEDCRRPPNHCDAHHIRHRADGGETKLPNLGLLCRRHHSAVHDLGLVIRRRADGRFEVVDPGGRAGRRRPRRPPPIACAA